MMRIPLLPGKFACNGGKASRVLQNHAAFAVGCGPIPLPASSGIPRQMQGKIAARRGIAAELACPSRRKAWRRGSAAARPKLIRLIIHMTGDTIALSEKVG
jgi:hypothetical protein